MVFTIEIRLVDGEGVDEMFDFVAYFAAQICEVAGKRLA